MSGRRWVAPLVAVVVAALGAFAIALALEAPFLRSVAAGAVVGLVAGAIAIAATATARRRNRSPVGVGLAVGGAVLLAALLYLILAVMFFSH